MVKRSLVFYENKQILTLGVELELQVLDGNSLLLTPRANEIIERTGSEKLKPEFFQSTLEIITGVCQSVHDVQKDLQQTLDAVRSTANDLRLKIASTGTHPEADYRDRQVTPSPRYDNLMDRNQWIIRRMAVYGMHVHLGMRSGDECIAFHNFFLHFVPHLLALSASSPFWQRMNTGLASSRPTTYEAMPTSGMPYVVKNWRQFERLYHALVRTGSINSIRDLWLDLRPSPGIGTLELRVCDEPATLAESLAITAYVHTLAMWFRDNREKWLDRHPVFHRWILRENKWRALRYGLNGEMIRASNKRTLPMKEDINFWLERLAPYAEKHGYKDFFLTLRKIVQHGSSSERQSKIFQDANNLHAVTRHNVNEFEKQQPIWE